MDPKTLQELALQVARLPRADRLQFIHAVLSLAELNGISAPPDTAASARADIELHGEPVLEACREKLSRVRELAARPGWGHAAVALLAGVLYVAHQGAWDALFTTPLLNRVISDLKGADGWALNVQSLHGLERRGFLVRRPDTHPVQFCFSPAGYRHAAEIAEKPG